MRPLIAGVDRFGGSVIRFADDAVSCWFDQNYRRLYHRERAPAWAAAQVRQ
jgi:hypothetical protein